MNHDSKLQSSKQNQRLLTSYSSRLSKFVEKYEDYENDDVLFLVHYNGHGSIRNRKSYWHPTGFAARRSDASDP